jgi:hypothetical protein
MHVDISKNGCLCITPETELEAYALDQWCKKNDENLHGVPIIIMSEIKERQPE